MDMTAMRMKTDSGTESKTFASDTQSDTQNEESDIQDTDSDGKNVYIDMAAMKSKSNDSEPIPRDAGSLAGNEGSSILVHGLSFLQRDHPKPPLPPPLPPIPPKRDMIEGTTSTPQESLENVLNLDNALENKQLKDQQTSSGNNLHFITSGISSGQGYSPKPPLPPIPEKRDTVESISSRQLDTSEHVQENRSLTDEPTTSGIYMDMSRKMSPSPSTSC